MSPEQNAFIEQLYHQHFRALKGYAFRYIFDWDKAEVAVQETFCIAVEKVDDLMSRDEPLRWLQATVKNTIRNMIKHERYQKALFVRLEELQTEPGALADFGAKDTDEFCQRIAGEENFHLFKHIAVDGFSYIEAAKELDIGVWACRKRVQRTIEKLQAGLKKDFR